MNALSVSRLVLAAALLAASAPLANAFPVPCDSSDACGVLVAGTGAPVAPGVDHDRYAVPIGAVGVTVDLVPDRPGVGATVLFGLLHACPPDMACTQEFLGPPCLAVYAAPGAAAVPYAFSWAFDEDDAHVLFRDLPHLWRAPAPDVACRGFPVAELS